MFSQSGQALTNTLIIMAGSAAIAGSMGGAAGWLLGRSSRFWNAWRVAFLAAAFIPLYVQTAAWDAAWGSLGWVTLTQAGDRQSAPWSGILAATWVHGLAAAPWSALLVGATARNLRASLLDAARLEGRDGYVARRIELPLLIPAAGIGGLIAAAIAATEIVVTDLLRVETLAEQTYLRYSVAPAQAPAAMARALPAAICLIAAASLERQRNGRRRGWPTRSGSGATTDPDHPYGAAPGQSIAPPDALWRIVTGGVASTVWLLVALVPLLNLFIKAGWQVVGEQGEIVHRWSPTRVFTTVVEAAVRFTPEILWTVALAGVTLSLTIPMATLLTLFLRRFPGCRWWLAAGGILLVLMPGPTVAMWLIAICNQPSLPWLNVLYDQTLVPTAVALLPRAIPVATCLLLAADEGLPSDWFGQARLEGVSWAQRGWKLWWPLRAGWVVAMVGWIVWLALADVSAVLLLLPPGVTTIGPRVFGLLHSGVRHEESGLCLLVIGLLATAWGFGGWLMPRLWRRSGFQRR